MTTVEIKLPDSLVKEPEEIKAARAERRDANWFITGNCHEYR